MKTGVTRRGTPSLCVGELEAQVWSGETLSLSLPPLPTSQCCGNNVVGIGMWEHHYFLKTRFTFYSQALT